MDTLFDSGLRNALMATGLALVVIAVGAAVRRPALTHALWLLVLLRLLVPPVWTVPVAPRPAAEPAPPAAPAGEAALVPLTEEELLLLAAELPPPGPAAPAATEPEPPPAAPFPWRAAVGCVWLAGAAAMLLLTLVRMARFQRELRRAARDASAADAGWQARVDELAKRLGLRRGPPVRLVPGRVAPLVWAGWGRACLVLPRGLLERLSPEQQESLLVHELAHLRRGDHWVRQLELAVGVLYWWLPLVWWARRQLREAEEQCCDAWVVWALPGSRRAYATTLVETLDFLAVARPKLPAFASGAGPVRPLRRRLTMIMKEATPRRLSRLGVVAVAGLGALLLALAPTWAQEPEQPPPDRPGRSRAEPPPPPPQARMSADEQKKIQDELNELKRVLDRMTLEDQARRKLEAAIRSLEDRLGSRGERRALGDRIQREGPDTPRPGGDRAPRDGDLLEQQRLRERVEQERAAVEAQRAAAEAQRRNAERALKDAMDRVRAAEAEARDQAERARAQAEEAQARVKMLEAQLAELRGRIERQPEQPGVPGGGRPSGPGGVGGPAGGVGGPPGGLGRPGAGGPGGGIAGPGGPGGGGIAGPGGPGGPGGMRGSYSGPASERLFDAMSGGKDVINRDDLEERMRPVFDRLAERLEIKGGTITRDQFKELLKKNPSAAGPGGPPTPPNMPGAPGRAPGGPMPPAPPGTPGAQPPPGPPGGFPGGGPIGTGGNFGGGGGTGGGGRPARSADAERIQHLEQMVEEMRRDLSELRRELKQPTPPPTTPPPTRSRGNTGGGSGNGPRGGTGAPPAGGDAPPPPTDTPPIRR